MFSLNFDKIKNGIQKSRFSLISKVKSIFSGTENKSVDIENLEEILISSDIGANLTDKLLSYAQKKSFQSYEDILNNLKESMRSILKKVSSSKEISEKVIILVGVNGAGKTTTLGKLASLLNDSGEKVLIIPADTFRAAANEQLTEWSKRSSVDIFKSNSFDPSAVIYEGLKYGTSNGFTKILIDTAGRLQTKSNLMSELKKIKNVLNKILPRNEVKVLLVIDATAGQNGISQAVEFNNFIELDGFILTKLDGTAKGGIIFQIIDRFNIPIYYIGIGENINDLIPFSIDQFIESFFAIE